MELKKLFALWIVIYAFGVSGNAQIQLPAVFTDGMVLQQNDSVNFWGWATSGDQLSIVADWNVTDTVKTVVTNQSKWFVKLKTGKAGGPYTIRIVSPKQQYEVKDVLLGEVWLCSGQSNMEWSALHGIKDGDREVEKAYCNTLRIFHVNRQAADYPQVDCRSKWEHSTSESMRRTSATAYFFGRYLSEHLNVPVGIIVSAWGGTPAEVWTPANVIETDSVLSVYDRREHKYWPTKPGTAYNQMIHPIVPYNMAGCIWYQGESNHRFAANYGLLMKSMVEAWRKNFGRQFPFYYVQIAPHTYKSANNTPAQLREQQWRCLQTIENTGMINISDLVENVKDIHPRNKKAIGERLANMALDKNYKMFVGAYESPSLEKVNWKKDWLILQFKGNFEKIKLNKLNHAGILVSGENTSFRLADYKVEGKQIRISTKGLQAPYKLLYCYDDDSIGMFYTEAGVPFLPFRMEGIEKSEERNIY